MPPGGRGAEGFQLAPTFNLLWTIWLCVAILYGVCIGSFLNVVIYRLPLGQSVAEPVWSYCPNCKHRLSTLDLIPLFSFLALGTKCRYCRTPISWRYFGVELLTGVLFGLVYLHDGPSAACIFDSLFVALLVPIFFIDLEQFIIPNELCALGVALGLARGGYAIWQGEPGQWMQIPWLPVPIMGAFGSAIICALLFHLISFAGLLYYAGPKNRTLGLIADFWRGIGSDYTYIFLKYLGFGLWLLPARRLIENAEREDAGGGGEAAAESDAVVQEAEVGAAHGSPLKTRAEIAEEIESDEQQTGMGQGDAKLAAMIGATLLMPLSLVSFFLAVLSGTLVGVALIARRGGGGGGGGRTAIPFGPFLVCGAILALLVGAQLMNWYLHFAFGAAGGAR